MSEDALVPGSRIGIYEIVLTLGRGCTSTVYKAKHQDTNQDVALKVSSKYNYRAGSLRWENEIGGIIGRHPNLVGTHELGEEGKWLYLSMDYVGHNIEFLIDDCNQRFSLDRVLKIARDVARALDHMHSRGIVHSDVKTGNLLVSNGDVKLSDFGFSYDTCRKLPERKEGIVLGTPAFIAPEYLIGREPHAKGDIYSLGVCIFHMLSGDTPIRHDIDEIDKKFGDVSDMVFFMKHQFRSLPSPAGEICSKAVEVFPVDRFQSAGEFADALDFALKEIDSSRN